MYASLPFLSGRCPEEHIEAFTWIVEEVVAATNQARASPLPLVPALLFQAPFSRRERHPRLLSAYLARTLLGWSHLTLYKVFYPHSCPSNYSNALFREACKWIDAGCPDAAAGGSIGFVIDRVMKNFPCSLLQKASQPSPPTTLQPEPEARSAGRPLTRPRARPRVQNLDANEPPDPPPRRPARLPPLPAAIEPAAASVRIDQVITTVAHYFGLTKHELLSRSRHPGIVFPRQIGMYLARQLSGKSLLAIARRFNRADHTTALHAVRKITRLAANDNVFGMELAFLKGAVETYSRTGHLPLKGEGSRLVKPAFRDGAAAVFAPVAFSPDGRIADAPFVKRLHWRLVRSARLMGDSNRQFIAELISDAADARSPLALKPEPFAEVLAHAGPELPRHLAPYASLIEEKLFRFAASRSKIPAPALRAAILQMA